MDKKGGKNKREGFFLAGKINWKEKGGINKNLRKTTENKNGRKKGGKNGRGNMMTFCSLI